MENLVPKNVKNSPPFLVLLDSECMFCSRLGSWLRKRNKPPKFSISDARNWPSDCPWTQEISRDFLVYYSGNERWYAGEAAAIAIALDLGGTWRLLARILRFIPSPIRRLIYRFWSKNRYKIWGKSNACELPNEP